MVSNRTRRYKCRNKKKKIQMDRSHTKKRRWRDTKECTILNPQGNRKRGRPRNSWRRSVNEEVGRSWNELRFLAADRRKWKGLIDNLCSQKERWTLLFYHQRNLKCFTAYHIYRERYGTLLCLTHQLPPSRFFLLLLRLSDGLK